MEPIKMPLLISHFCCSLLDVKVCSLVTPYLFLPSIAFLGCGIFTSVGISHRNQLVIYLIVLFAVYLSILFLFENRNRFKIKKLSSKLVFYIGNYLVCMLSMNPFIHTPSNQEHAKLELLQQNPCPAPEFFSPDVFVWMSDTNWINFIFFVKSNQTRNLQRRFFIGTVIQAGIPTALIVIPYVVVTGVSAVGGITQSLTNSLFIIIGLHGVVESAIYFEKELNFQLLKSQFQREVVYKFSKALTPRQ
ncbi:Protein CBG05442 [Caenorhabditis briggsae]|uniref:Protein CBG05442 n=1 Tax=Caenorhabditis briggsae TaxID=6238 RepID=E3CTY1_CAEBR|nr:Protein CBG05442 [Caenorhabditis briggsae]CBX33024.1 Protein CBG05442 [Caenorhabditis briggsae]